MPPLRILHTADSHLGAGLPARPRHDRPRRGEDFLDSYRRVLEPALRGAVDVVIHAGDLFDKPSPSTWAALAAAEPLLEVASAGVPVVLIPGNHERSAMPSNLLLSHPRIDIVAEPRTIALTVRDCRLAITALPCIRHQVAPAFEAALHQSGWSRSAADIRLLVTHQAFDGAVCGPANYRFHTGDSVLARDSVPESFHAVLSGHIHRHQVLERPGGGGPPIIYSGSPDRITFAEIDEPKGGVLLEHDGAGLRHHFREHRVRPMAVLPLDVTGRAVADVHDAVATWLSERPAGSVAQIRLTGHVATGALRGLRLRQFAESRRPDLMLSVVARDVEWASARAGSRPSRCAFHVLHGDAGPIEHRSATDPLPATRGVYALHAADGRLLYVGKAANVRTRVQTHRRGTGGGGFFRGWGRDVARIAVLSVDNDCAAQLIEAVLIRHHRPPFNRRMRRWQHYRYLVPDRGPFGELAVTTHPAARCFGPYRSRHQAEAIRAALSARLGLAACPAVPPRPQMTLFDETVVGLLCDRYYAGLCSGPCAQRIAPAAYAELLRCRDGLLDGTDDRWLRALEQGAEHCATTAEPDADRRTALAQLRVLRDAHEHGVLLRIARRLSGALVVMHGTSDHRLVIGIDSRGLRFDHLDHCVRDAQRLHDTWRALHARCQRGPRHLALAEVDSRLLLARAARQPQPPVRVLVDPSRVGGAAGLLEAVFAPAPLGPDNPPARPEWCRETEVTMNDQILSRPQRRSAKERS